MPKQVCVYTHKRPDGEPFYIGKGVVQRAFDFAPSRRSKWHKNIVNKYGRTEILIEIVLCDTEQQAFDLEVKKIVEARSQGFDLVNLTNGGEGASGRKITERQKANLEKGRRFGKKGVKGPRPQLEKWLKTENGLAHIEKLKEIGRVALHKERIVKCCECGCDFKTTSAKAKNCSRLCEQRNRRAKQKNDINKPS